MLLLQWCYFSRDKFGISECNHYKILIRVFSSFSQPSLFLFITIKSDDSLLLEVEEVRESRVGHFLKDFRVVNIKSFLR